MATTSLTSYLSDGFFTKLKDIAARRNFNPEAALAVMFSETGVTPGPDSLNKAGAPASGIFGKYFNTRDEAVAFTKLSAEEQLDDYDAYMAPYTNVPKPTAANIYQLNFLPASIIPGTRDYRGTDDDAVLASRDGTGYGGQEAAFYRANAAYLDVDGDGQITVGDLAKRLLMAQRENPAKWAELMSRLGDHASLSSSKKSLLPLFGVAFLVGAAYFVATTPAAGLRRLLPR